MASESTDEEAAARSAAFEQGFQTWLDSTEGVAAVNAMVEHAIDAFQRDAAAMAQLVKLAQGAVRAAATAAMAIQRWWDANGAQVADFLVALSRMPTVHRDTVVAYGAICVRLAWPPTMQIPWPHLVAVVEADRSGAGDANTEAVIREVWAACFDDTEVARIAERWWRWKVVEARRGLLEQALAAHFEGRYALSVPVLLAQIEGVLADAFAHRGRLNGFGVKGANTPYLRLLAAGADPFLGTVATTLLHAEGVTFARFERGEPWHGLNRHAVLHGADLDYATRERSLQAILTFDLIVDALGWIELGDGVAHRPGCQELARVRGDGTPTVIRVVHDWSPSRPDGLTACAICNVDAD
jgi:hypothetical protein